MAPNLWRMAQTKIPVLVLLLALVLPLPACPGSSGGPPPGPAPAGRPALDGEGEIRGRVFAEGASVAAVVELRWAYEEPPADAVTPGVPAGDGPPLAVVEAGPDGIFVFRKVPFALFEVRARGQDDRTASAWVHPEGAEREVEARILLPADGEARHELRGVAVRSDGSPFRGLVGPAAAGDPSVAPFEAGAVATDAEGRFRLDDLPAGAVLLRALAPGELSHVVRRVPVPHAGELRLVVDAGVEWTDGRVVDGATGAPVAGARVDTVAFGGDPGDAEPFFARAATDAEGRFRAPWGETFVDLTVRADGHVPFRREYRERPDPLEVPLTRPVTVTGRVVAAATGVPVAGVTVHWRPIESPVAPDVAGGEAVSGDDGRFVLRGVAPGRALVYARDGDYVPQEIVGPPSNDPLTALSRAVGPDGADAGDLRVVPAGAIGGRVLRENGTPVAGARVRTFPDTSPGGGIDAGFGAEAVTDAEGRFRIAGLLPGRPYRVSTGPEGVAPATAEGVVPRSGETETVELRLSPGRWVDVTVVTKGTGAPVEGAIVGARTEGGGGPSGTGTPLPGEWVTGADGKVRVGPIPPGAIVLGAFADGYLALGGIRGDGRRIEPGATEARLELEPELRVAGRVRRPDGSPAAGAWLDVTRAGSPERWRTTIGKDGRFEVGGLGAGTVSLRATLDEDGKTWTGRREVAAGTTDVDLELAPGEPGGTDEVIVVLRGPDGGGIYGARAAVDTERERRERDVEEGRLLIPLDAGSRGFMLEIWAPRNEGLRPLPFGAVRRGPIPPLPQLVEIVLPPEKTIAGRVVDDAGAAVAGVTVRARPRWTGEPVSDRVHGEATTDATGAFRIGQLADIGYRLELEVPPEYAPPDFVDAAAGETIPDVVLTKGTAVEVTVLAPDGAPAAGAKVQVRRGIPGTWRSETIREVVAGEDGRVRIAGLDPAASYRLVVLLEMEPDRWEQAALLGKWRPADTVVRTEEPR